MTEAMKAQINRNNKSELITSLDFNVKNPNVDEVSAEILEQEDLTWEFREWYCEYVFGRIKEVCKPDCWILSGRSNGWYTVCFLIKPTSKEIEKVEKIVSEYSMDGYIEYHWEENGAFSCLARYRVGNLNGQGSCLHLKDENLE